MSIVLDKAGEQIELGDRIYWMRGSCFGEICGLPSEENARERAHDRMVQIKWDHARDPIRWQNAANTTVCKVSEEEIKRFFEGHNMNSAALGGLFLMRYEFKDPILGKMRCPGKAAQRIIETFAGPANRGWRS